MRHRCNKNFSGNLGIFFLKTRKEKAGLKGIIWVLRGERAIEAVKEGVEWV